MRAPIISCQQDKTRLAARSKELQVTEKVIRGLIEFGLSAVPALIVAAKNIEIPRIRRWPVQALGAIGDKRAAGSPHA